MADSSTARNGTKNMSALLQDERLQEIFQQLSVYVWS
tara:strand:- start:1253 stop:1363 length:111 start_codon:yes stop_codon:yes gene_type:complete